MDLTRCLKKIGDCSLVDESIPLVKEIYHVSHPPSHSVTRSLGLESGLPLLNSYTTMTWLVAKVEQKGGSVSFFFFFFFKVSC